MRKVLFGVIITLFLLLIFQYWSYRNGRHKTVFESTQLIQEQIKNVGQLIVTEGHFSEVYNYKDQQNYLGDYLSFEKKALVVINAEVTISYNLEKIKYDIDEANKTVRILNIPEEIVRIDPKLTFYDINQSIFNPFTGEDYNKIQNKVRDVLQDKVNKSSLKSNAENRLVSELSKLLILTNSFGWTLKYHSQTIEDMNILQEKHFKD